MHDDIVVVWKPNEWGSNYKDAQYENHGNKEVPLYSNTMKDIGILAQSCVTLYSGKGLCKIVLVIVLK